MQSAFAIPEDTIRAQATRDGITHLSTGVAIVKDGKVLAVRRATDDFLGGYFELPGGGVDPGETLEEAVRREVKEETGLEVVEILGMFPGFEYTTPKKPKVRQLNFVVSVVADGDVALSSEHDDFQWMSRDDISTLPVTDSMKTCLIAAFDVIEDLRP